MTDQPWIVMRAGRGRNWGGEVRRARIFERLAERTSAVVVDDWLAAKRSVHGRRWEGWLRRNRPKPRLAASEGAPPSWLDRIGGFSDPVAVAFYDDRVAQARALGLRLSPERESELSTIRHRNEAAFRWHVVPTRSFAIAHGFDLDRIIVGGQGTVTSHVVPGPWPDRPSVGMVSGAAPGRGIETLIEAMRLVRGVVADARLFLWLSQTSGHDDGYLDGLHSQTAADDWISIAEAPYDQLGPTLAQATVLTIPHPALEYMDVILPVKLFDSLAAGRPLVVTPRRETVAIIAPNRVGLVAADDSAAALADAFVRLLSSEPLAREMGAAARDLAVREFDWGVLGDRIADEILQREGGRLPA